jgi:hypothetical protein
MSKQRIPIMYERFDHLVDVIKYLDHPVHFNPTEVLFNNVNRTLTQELFNSLDGEMTELFYEIMVL